MIEFNYKAIIKEKNNRIKNLLNKCDEKNKEIERLNNVIKDINKILKNDDLCHIEKLQEIHKLVGSDKE